MKRMMDDEEKIVKCIDVTANLIHVAIESGKFDAKDGEVSECMKLTSPDFIDRYGRRKVR